MSPPRGAFLSRRAARLAPFAALLALAACRDASSTGPRPDASPAAVASATATSPPPAPPPRARELAKIENRRAFGEVRALDLADRDVEVRRAAARALARIADPRGVPTLTSALSDEDADVVAFAAYGLGWICRDEGVETAGIVRALALRGAAVEFAPPPRLDPVGAIARALGRCATDEAEATLVAWLAADGPRAERAALGLGDLAGRRKGLAATTQVALLAAAAGTASSPALGAALFAFGRFDRPAATMTGRLLEVARGRLASRDPSRRFAVKAISRAGEDAADDLERLLVDVEGADPAERAEAARGLARLGSAGQAALGRALGRLAPEPSAVASTQLATASFGPLVATLDAIRKAGNAETRAALKKLASLPVPPEAPQSIATRVARLRCGAAALVARSAFDPLIAACDAAPDGLRAGLATVRALDRATLEGPFVPLFRKLAASPTARVREAALELVEKHPELDARAPLADALGADAPGVVATAASVLASRPDAATSSGTAPRRAASGDGTAEGVDPAIAAALAKALARAWPPDAVEATTSLIDAAGALKLEAATARLDALCASDSPTVREHAARALGALRKARAACPPVAAPTPAPETEAPLASPVALRLSTDAGELVLRLDPALAPTAVTRVVELARAGFFAKTRAHRVVPGFVVQFGDPAGDGFGGAGRAPLRCETSPAPFERLRVGMALSGRDTGSSQIFVTLGWEPHLDGDYTLVGTAEGDWDAVAEGDAIVAVEVVDVADASR